MRDICVICGMDFNTPSFGGPGICPACDCGIQPDSIHHPRNQHRRLLSQTDTQHNQAAIATAEPSPCPSERKASR